MVVEPRQTQRQTSSTTEIKTLTLWLNAFIPRDLEGAQVVPGSGEHAGKTMLPTPGPINACFLTDQRGFSDDPRAHSRMHSEIELDVEKRRMSREYHHCHETIQVDCETGAELCNQLPSPDRMKFSNFRVLEDGALAVDLSGATHNPCLTVASLAVSPNLDYSGTIKVTLRESNRKALVGFEGSIEVYPAFELYVQVNGGPVQAVFREEVQPGATPVNLVGPPARSIVRQIEVSV